MKKLWSVIIGLVILFTSMPGCAAGNLAVNAASGNATGFNLIFKYGFSGRNELDTYRGTFTKDMGLDAPITIGLRLTAEEMETIYRKIVEVDFFSYPDKFSVNLPAGVLETRPLPYDTYFFRVTRDGQTKELLWHEKVTNSEPRADKLRELINLIRGMIESKDEYKNLPESKSGYL
jgi:hypothetical protein